MPTWNPFKKDETDKKDGAQNQADIDALVEKLGATFDARMKPLSDKIEGIEQKWNALETAATRASEPPLEKKEPADPAVEPERWKAENLGPLAAQTILTNARLTEREIIDEISANWSHLIPKIREYFANTQIQRKAQADYAEYCRNIVDMVIGKAAKEAGLRFDGQNKKFFLEDASTKGTNGEPSIFDGQDLNYTTKDGKIITPAEQLARLGIDPKEFAENAKKGLI